VSPVDTSVEKEAVTIRVLDKEYQIACPVDDTDALLESARILDGKMREIRENRKMVGADRVAVMAALNIAHDLLQCESGKGAGADTKTRIRSLQAKVEAAISRGKQLEL
jgi:cell division protein ZapA